MGVLRGYRCDACRIETYDYEPKGWRWVDLNRKGVDGIQQTNDRNLFCSDDCEWSYWQNIKQELFGTEN